MTPSPTRWRRRRWLGLTAGLVIGAVALGGGSAWAFWSANATATSSVTTPTVAITQSNFSSLSTTYLNTITSLKNTGSFTVTNTGTVAGTVQVKFTATGSMAPAPSVVAWATSAAGNCTPAASVGSPSATGTWSNLTLSLGSTTVAPGGSQAFCVRSTVAGGASLADAVTLATPSGTQTLTPTLTASLSAGSWTATDTTGVNTQKSEAIYPLASGYQPGSSQSAWYSVTSGSGSASDRCAGALSGGSASGTAVVSSACNQKNSQTWQITSYSSTTPATVTLRSMHSWNTSLGLNASGSAQLASTSGAQNQQWHVQQVSSGRYQFVSPTTGKCLVLGAASSSAMPTADCNTANVVVGLNRKPVSGLPQGSSGITFTFPVINEGQPLYLQWEGILGWYNWSTLSASSSSTASTTVTPAALMGSGNINVRIRFTNSTSSSGDDILWQGVVNRPSIFNNQLTLVTGGD